MNSEQVLLSRIYVRCCGHVLMIRETGQMSLDTRCLENGEKLNCKCMTNVQEVRLEIFDYFTHFPLLMFVWFRHRSDVLRDGRTSEG